MDAVEEVFAKQTLLDHADERTMGGAHESHVHRDGRLASYAANVPGFEYAKESSLQREWELRDLVEKKRAAVGALEGSSMRLNRPCEGASLVAEELTLDEFRRESPRIDGDEGPRRTRAPLVQCSGDHFFADSGFAAHEHRPWQTREAIHVSQDIQHRSGLDHWGVDTRAPRRWTARRAQLGPADPKNVPRPQGVSPDGLPVDPSAVGASQVSNDHPSVGGLNPTVKAADGAVGKHDVVVGA